MYDPSLFVDEEGVIETDELEPEEDDIDVRKQTITHFLRDPFESLTPLKRLYR
jgi:hypothetical protein